jgi:hypothetical protein
MGEMRSADGILERKPEGLPSNEAKKKKKEERKGNMKI